MELKEVKFRIEPLNSEVYVCHFSVTPDCPYFTSNSENYIVSLIPSKRFCWVMMKLVKLRFSDPVVVIGYHQKVM